MKSDILVSTMPIKPQKRTNIGMLIAPTLVDLLGSVYNCEKIISMNSLNSYENKESQLNIYKNDIDKNKIHYDSIFVDKENADKIMNIIEKLYKDNHLKIKYKEKIRCDCGKVDILENTISKNAKLFYMNEENNIICKQCGKICKKYNEKSLVLELDKNIDDSIKIAPIYLKKEINYFSSQFKGQDILVSKNRNTGYDLNLDKCKFNIDIDFLWNNYFKLFEQDKQILIASNHQLLLMYLMNYLSKISSKKDITFVANPYILNKNEILDSKIDLNDSESYKKLFILYNLRWRQKDCYWSSSVIDYLNSISSTKLNNLYKVLLESSKELIECKNIDLDEQISNILIDCTNMQENIKTMKKMFKNGLL